MISGFVEMAREKEVSRRFAQIKAQINANELVEKVECYAVEWPSAC